MIRLDFWPGDRSARQDRREALVPEKEIEPCGAKPRGVQPCRPGETGEVSAAIIDLLGGGGLGGDCSRGDF